MIFGSQLYAPQTRILEGRTNVSERVFDALFKGVSTVFGLQNVEKSFMDTVGRVNHATHPTPGERPIDESGDALPLKRKSSRCDEQASTKNSRTFSPRSKWA